MIRACTAPSGEKPPGAAEVCKNEVAAITDIVENDVLSSFYPEDLEVFFMPTNLRRHYLKTTRGFSCVCARCKKAADVGVDGEAAVQEEDEVQGCKSFNSLV